MDDAPLLAIAVEQIRDQLRLEQILRALGIVPQGNDFHQLAAGELQNSFFLIEVRIRAGEDLDRVRPDVVPSHPVINLGAIAGAAQVLDHFVDVDLVADHHGLRGRKQHGRPRIRARR